MLSKTRHSVIPDAMLRSIATDWNLLLFPTSTRPMTDVQDKYISIINNKMLSILSKATRLIQSTKANKNEKISSRENTVFHPRISQD